VLAQDTLDEPAQIGPDILANRPINRHVVPHCRCDELIEEELVELIKVRAEALVDEIDQLRQQHLALDSLSPWKTWWLALHGGLFHLSAMVRFSERYIGLEINKKAEMDKRAQCSLGSAITLRLCFPSISKQMALSSE
jgi:hypothetical protein